MKELSALPGLLLPWYRSNRRDLAWRKTREPYCIWVSEIMLQQTRVEAVKGYYSRFLTALPDVKTLAECDDDTLHKLWEGLGYYSRVRNLKKAAQVLVERYGGRFPEDYGKILALPGIGEYTAGAICSIAFNHKTPAVDGNVLRVMSRLLDDPAPIDDPKVKKRVRALLEAIYPAEAGDFTQALMELGATVCGPNREPRCDQCPCRELCLGYARGTGAGLPVKAPKKEKRQEDRTVFIFSCDGRYALEKRPAKGLLAGLWQFPNVAGHLDAQGALDMAREMGLHSRQLTRQLERKHIFTHIRWDMVGYYIEVDRAEGGFCWFTTEQIEGEAALPTAFRQFWEER